MGDRVAIITLGATEPIILTGLAPLLESPGLSVIPRQRFIKFMNAWGYCAWISIQNLTLIDKQI